MIVNEHTLFLIVMILAVISMFLEDSPNDHTEYWNKVWKNITEKEDP